MEESKNATKRVDCDDYSATNRFVVVASSVQVLPERLLLVGANPNPLDQHNVLAAHFKKCSKNNLAFHTQFEYKNFRSTVKRAEIFVDSG